MASTKVVVRCSVSLALQTEYVEERQRSFMELLIFSLEDTIAGWIRLHLEYFNL